MTDEIDRLKEEEKKQQLQDNEWAWIEENQYEQITIDDLKEQESELITISGMESNYTDDQQGNDWGWGRLVLIISFLIGFTIFVDASVIRVLSQYWWLIFIVIAWRNQQFKLKSWSAFVLAFFAWTILVSAFGLPGLLTLGAIALVGFLFSR